MRALFHCQPEGIESASSLLPLAEQRRIVAKVDGLMALCYRLEAQLTSTQTQSRRMLESVLHQALAPRTSPLKHLPFQSSYREEFEVVEQLQDDLRLFPRTDRLPVLLRALNLEFFNALPGYIARVDHRDDGFHKLLRKVAALMFCAGIKASRQDQMRLYSLFDPDLVGRVTVVQQLTRNTRRGPIHRFRFYGGEDFFPKIHLSGKRLEFTDHVLQRFSTRVPNNVGEDFSFFLLAFYGSPMISLPLGPDRAFIVQYGESVLAFAYTESDQEFVITTCLTVHAMHSLSLEIPTLTFNLHYDSAFAKPKLRNWLPHQWAANLHSRWERKPPLLPPVSFKAHTRVLGN